MKTSKFLLLFIIMSLSATLQIQAQEIEATLSGSTSSETFSVKDNGGNILFRVRGDGKVGIGTINPGYKLTINDGRIWISGTAPYLSFDPDGNTGVISVGGAGKKLQLEGTDGIDFQTFGTFGWQSSMFISDVGNVNIAGNVVGIGTTSPNSPAGFTGFLNIEGTSDASVELSASNFSGTKWTLGMNSSNFSIRRNGSEQHITVLNSGNVGIGSTSPTAKVDVTGSTGYDQLRMRTSFTPTGTSDASGNTGDIAWDVNYIYIKTLSGWKRAALSTF